MELKGKHFFPGKLCSTVSTRCLYRVELIERLSKSSPKIDLCATKLQGRVMDRKICILLLYISSAAIVFSRTEGVRGIGEITHNQQGEDKFASTPKAAKLTTGFKVKRVKLAESIDPTSAKWCNEPASPSGPYISPPYSSGTPITIPSPPQPNPPLYVTPPSPIIDTPPVTSPPIPGTPPFSTPPVTTNPPCHETSPPCQDMSPPVQSNSPPLPITPILPSPILPSPSPVVPYIPTTPPLSSPIITYTPPTTPSITYPPSTSPIIQYPPPTTPSGQYPTPIPYISPPSPTVTPITEPPPPLENPPPIPYTSPPTPSITPIIPPPPSIENSPPTVSPTIPISPSTTPYSPPILPTYPPPYTETPTIPSPPTTVPPPTSTTPSIGSPPTYTPSTPPGQGLWCVAKPTVADSVIEQAMNYACGAGADCLAIQPNGACYLPDTVIGHASYAFNSYFQATKGSGGSCDFGGTAMIVTVDPSYDGCRFLYNYD